jgi:glycosyltransferase involved in cell wall biosynthesis
MMPRVSVVIPSYNHERFVGAAVESVLAQSWTDLELIVVDDRSTDGSTKMFERVRDSRFHFTVQPENLGISAAMNAGIRASRGEFVAVLGSDDSFRADKLAAQVAVLDAHPDVAAVFTRPEVVDDDGRLRDDAVGREIRAVFDEPDRPRHQWLARLFDKGNRLCHPSSMMRRSAFDEIGWYDERLAQLQDQDLWLRLLSRHEIRIIPERMTFYRRLRSGGSLSSPEQPGKVARTMWETSKVLRHYLALSEADLEAVFGGELIGRYRALGLTPPFMVADIASQVPSQAYQLFALDALFELLPASGAAGPWHRHLMRIAGQVDPMGIQLIRSLQQAQASHAAASPPVLEMRLDYRHLS